MAWQRVNGALGLVVWEAMMRNKGVVASCTVIPASPLGFKPPVEFEAELRHFSNLPKCGNMSVSLN